MSEFCNVKNRSGSHVVYSIPEMGVRRSFAPGETKKITYEELERLTYQPGGMAILASYLQISDIETINNLNMRVEPEYHMNEQQVANLMVNGSLDEFLDALDFAPNGVIDLIKRYAISMPLMDIPKREALKKKTGLDVDKALANIQAEKEDDEKKESIDDSRAPKQRRVQENATPQRRTTPQYNVVAKEAPKVSE